MEHVHERSGFGNLRHVVRKEFDTESFTERNLGFVIEVILFVSAYICCSHSRGSVHESGLLSGSLNGMVSTSSLIEVLSHIESKIDMSARV